MDVSRSHATTSKSIDAGRRTTANLSIAQYLIRRLQDYGIAQMFGIPGDYVLSLYSELEKSPIEMIGCTREDCAGFAADAYARINGMGAVCVTYCVGGLSVCNSIAGAYAEKSPVVVVTGSPGLKERSRGALLHHMVRDFRTQYDVFEKFTIAGTELSDPLTAFSEIDRVLDACDRFKRPVYLEIPRDMVRVVPPITHSFRGVMPTQDPEATGEAIKEAVQLIRSAKQPVIVAGVELHRFALQDELLTLAENANIPIATTMLGKSVISEQHPSFIGLYEGALGDQAVTRFVEESDLVLLLGAFLSDINLGIFSANLRPSACIYATSEELRISHHHYHNVGLKDFLDGLGTLPYPERELQKPIKHAANDVGAVESDSTNDDNTAPNGLRTSWMIQQINQRLDGETIVVADVGDSLFAATELTIHDRGEFLSPAYYTSMGFAIPAALGAATAKPDHRVVALVGDGAFQMTGQELSTLIRYGHNPIVIVLDNHGYGTERYLHAGDWVYNEIQPWNYCKLLDVYGRGKSHLVATESEFKNAFEDAWNDAGQLHLIQAKLAENDASDTLRNLASRMSRNVS
ncbi:alpha-keto acid decarboxylase family protein [Rhodopirellula sp. MGV]|uniref:alpha-keto acid decarboxylase family protein n=1 Tax=Rhodopirellula sp. MGV TaxID=2023130 RepID=UPI000B975E6F|nr:thiamine pyrophosphate-dependent enzyme [Rhodopirellula sp. MGV]OYP31700.1 preprotein translocase subunit Tim44 [Rhodopirellula sp. MGV]PNY34001.1 preprotein translocase subunit Tim44 [Rhodopirellula baltica]